MKKSAFNRILEETESGYDQMAEKFSGTRSFFWPDLEFIKDYVQEGNKIFDFGCGNGRLLQILEKKNIEYYGADVSQKLIDLAKEKYPQFAHNFRKTSGQAGLDFPDDFFDGTVSIAVFHHFPEKDFRLGSAKELYRITKPGGFVIITVWNLWQKKYRKYVWKEIFRKMLGISRFDFLDCEIPFRNNQGESFKRFHHAYTEKEMRELFSEAGFEAIETSVINNKNIVLVGKKYGKES